jgi:hypothetical protein
MCSHLEATKVESVFSIGEGTSIRVGTAPEEEGKRQDAKEKDNRTDVRGWGDGHPILLGFEGGRGLLSCLQGVNPGWDWILT